MAADVAAALNDFYTKQLTVWGQGNQVYPWLAMERNPVISVEPITNMIIISAAPEFFDEIMHLAVQLDFLPQQVVLQVMVAEVQLNNNYEFGVEMGLQSPVLFQRGIFPAPGQAGTTAFGTIPTANSFGSLPVVGATPDFATITGMSNPLAVPGFLFNNVINDLGNNPVVNPSQVGFQGLTNLGTGRQSPNNPGFGGFVFSANSGTVSMLIRALQVQSRLEILSRPQIMTLDNQTALINVGQDFPLIGSSNVTATGIVTTNVVRRQVGVILQVTPKISLDGRVVMRIIPEVSSVIEPPITLATGVFSNAIKIQHLETTVIAEDGQTVVLGGMISKSDNIVDNKVPWLGDLPGVGAMFRYRTKMTAKTELLIIMTPHIIRAAPDADRILATESSKMAWKLPNVLGIQGWSGMDPVLRSVAPPGLAPVPQAPPVPPGMLPPPADADGTLPSPRQLAPPADTTPYAPVVPTQPMLNNR
jgi:type II secretory pathway component GspD/PulD (secretin)